MLGTPPAFILSQDQTLLFVCSFPQDQPGPSFFTASFWFFCSLNFLSVSLESSGSHCCLFVKVLCRSLSDATLLVYHVFFFLSRPFLFFLFSLSLFCAVGFYYILSGSFCQQKFSFFYNFFLTENRAKKEISISQDSFSIYMVDNGERGI